MYVLKNSKEPELDAKVFLDKMNIDKGTMKQLNTMIAHPSCSHIRIMPDCHRGKNCCIGFTSHLNNDKIVPNYVGGDIGCGIITYNTKMSNFTKSYQRIEEEIRQVVPMGTEKNNINANNLITDADLIKLCTEAQEQLDNYIKKQNFDKEKSNQIKYDINWLKKKCLQIGINYNYALKSLGSLGGGNHYIELNKDSENLLYVTSHTGSRNFGGKICQYHQDKINETRRFDFKEFDNKMKKIKRKIKNNKIIKLVEDDIKLNHSINKHPDYLENDEALDYMIDMCFTQKYAQFNRKLILIKILNILNLPFEQNNLIESIHNYIDFDDNVLRKGAIAAHKNQLCIVSLNMKEGILICKGKGNEDWNNSCAHGLGRILNREQAKSRIKLHDFINSMKDVYSTSICYETIDESPYAYRNSATVINSIVDTVDIIEQLNPVINIKATT
jgi:tRNA-splicing ligase RtcB (3'-phosphate/5'-hydroxy nucleic acid ligase)